MYEFGGGTVAGAGRGGGVKTLSIVLFYNTPSTVDFIGDRQRLGRSGSKRKLLIHWFLSFFW